MLADYIDEIIMFLRRRMGDGYGFWLSELPVKDPLAQQQWQTRFGTMLKWIGPILLVISVVLAMSKSGGGGGG